MIKELFNYWWLYLICFFSCFILASIPGVIILLSAIIKHKKEEKEFKIKWKLNKKLRKRKLKSFLNLN